MTIILILLSLFATNIVWERTYPGCSFIDVHQTSDYGFIVAGNYYGTTRVSYQEQNDDRAYQPYLYKLSETGDLEWSTEVTPFGGSIKRVEELPDGGYAATGFFIRLVGRATSKELFLARLNEDGEVLWVSFQPSDNDEIGYAVSQLPTGGFVVLGVSNWACEYGSFILVFFDDVGTEIFRTSWGQASGESSSSTGYIISTDNDRILLCGSAYPYDWPPHPIQACFSYYGEQLWYRHYPIAGLWGREGYMRADGDCWFCTEKHALQIDTLSGDIVSDTYLGFNPGGEIIYSCDITFDGGLIAAGFRDYWGPIDCSGSSTMTEETEDGWIIKLSEAGEIMWQEHLENTSKDQSFYSVRQLSGGGYIAAGVYSGSGGWLVRFEPEQGIESQSDFVELKASIVSNPVYLPVVIEIELCRSAQVKIDLFDITGRIEESFDLFFEKGVHYIEFDNIQYGVHFVKITSDYSSTNLRFTVLAGT